MPSSFVSLVANGPYRAALEECCTATKRATVPLHVAALAADRRNGPGREYAPFLTRREECRGVGREMNFTATIRDPPTPQPELFSFFAEEPGGTRPDRIATLSGPQERDLRRTVQQIVDAVPLVPCLEDPAPQMVDQLQDIMRFFDALMPVLEQVIEVPKILLDDVPMRTTVRDTQLAEQLVEVRTIESDTWLQLSMEQNVDIPVPGRGGRIAGLQGFLPRQSSTALPCFSGTYF